MFYNVCEKCGAHLDPGEKCDCDAYSVEEGVQKNENTLKLKVGLKPIKKGVAGGKGNYMQTGA